MSYPQTVTDFDARFSVYLADMKDFAAMNEVYIEVSVEQMMMRMLVLISKRVLQFLPQPMPSRSCLQALAPGVGTVIEIECIAQA